jgi:phosphorylcholine metabolism protein LicD
MHLSTEDKNFIEAINIFNKNNIKYWVCHATLLGIIRDKNLIPWDHDIDLAVWEEDVSKKEIIDIMTKKDFKLRKKDTDDSSLHFIKKGGRLVDINFYKVVKTKSEQLGCLNFNVTENYLCKIIEALSQAKTYTGKLKYLIKIFYFFEFFFKKIKNHLIKKKLFYSVIVINQPLRLLREFDEIFFYKVKVRIPKKFDEYLVYIYGENWKIPIKKWNWTKDMLNIKNESQITKE